MEIKVRNLEPVVVKTLDELAVKNGFTFRNGKPKREEFLRWHLKQLCMLEEIKGVENRYFELVEKMSNVIRENQGEMMERLERIEDFVTNKDNRSWMEEISYDK